ncbi:MAG: hypothetical protein OXH68_07310 [Gammaproteobacteria bacterium]|nr:hypothetical protein [Gammaproteobacteria bacterium]
MSAKTTQIFCEVISMAFQMVHSGVYSPEDALREAYRTNGSQYSLSQHESLALSELIERLESYLT